MKEYKLVLKVGDKIEVGRFRNVATTIKAIELDELIKDHLDQSNLKKIESLEQKLINNLDEKSYSELIELKSQLNRE